MADQGNRPAAVADVHALAEAMPHVTRVDGTQENPVYQVGGRSFIFFRTPRPDAVDPETGERLSDVIGHSSVLVQASRLGELTRRELAELVQDAWLARASARRRAQWLTARADPAGPR